MTTEMTASDGTRWRVTRENGVMMIHDATGKQRLIFREGGLLASSAIESLAQQDREKKAEPVSAK